MSIFVDHRGVERWTCFATGANGTAIDLVMTATGRSVGESMAWLAERARLDRPPPERVPIPRRPPSASARQAPSAALLTYIDDCEHRLWQGDGAQVRRWLVVERRLDPEVLRRNRVGADPGPTAMRRAKGLPRRGRAAVFPALDEKGQALYLQARYLDPPADRGKYDNPTGRHGSNPRVTALEPVRAAADLTIVTEGVPDALSAATSGFRAVAVLGAGVPDDRVAECLAKGAGPLVLAFDADPAGRRGAARLGQLLRERGRRDVFEVTPPAPDLNAWLVEAGRDSLRRQLDLSIRLAAGATDRRRAAGRSRT